MAEEKGLQTVKDWEYEVSGGVKLKLSFDIVKKYLVSGDAAMVTNQEVMLFIAHCQHQKLNPFLREAYLIKYSKNHPASIVTGKDAFTKRANRHLQCEGWKAGIIVHSKDAKIDTREGCFYLRASEVLLGGWAEVHRKDRAVPVHIKVSLDEYEGKKADGSTNRQWSAMPATMIRKVALCQALREAFPEDLGGLYSEEEMAHALPETDLQKLTDDKTLELKERLAEMQNESDAPPEELPFTVPVDAETVEQQEAELPVEIVSETEVEKMLKKAKIDPEKFDAFCAKTAGVKFGEPVPDEVSNQVIEMLKNEPAVLAKAIAKEIKDTPPEQGELDTGK